MHKNPENNKGDIIVVTKSKRKKKIAKQVDLSKHNDINNRFFFSQTKKMTPRIARHIYEIAHNFLWLSYSTNIMLNEPRHKYHPLLSQFFFSEITTS